MRAVEKVAGSLLAAIKADPVYRDVFTKWREIVGDELADALEPLKVVKMNNSHMLVVKAISGNAIEWQHDTLRIINMLNRYFKRQSFFLIRVVCD